MTVSVQFPKHSKQELANHIKDQQWQGIDVVNDLDEIGNGMFPTMQIPKDAVVCDYYWKTSVFNSKSAREDFKNLQNTDYALEFDHGENYHVIHAPVDDKSMGRLLNHSRIHNNVKPMVHTVNSKVVIMMCAKEDIHPVEQLLFDYGLSYKDNVGDCMLGCVKCQECQ